MKSEVVNKAKRFTRQTVDTFGLRPFFGKHVVPLWTQYVEMTSPCVFIHVPKTAGTSIADAIGMKGITHSNAQEWKDHIGSKRFDERFKFTVVRHPIDRVVSGSLWGIALSGRNENEKNFGRNYSQPAEINDIDLSMHVNEGLRRSIADQNWRKTRLMKSMIEINGEPIVDYVGKFEDINEISETLRQKGLLKNEIPTLKSISKKTKKQIVLEQDVYDALSDIFKSDFDYLGYKPEDASYPVVKSLNDAYTQDGKLR